MVGKPGAEQALQSHICQGVKVWSDLPCSESCHDFCSGHSMSCVDAWWSSGADVCMLSLSAKCGDLAGSPWNDNDNLVCQCGSASANKKPPTPKVVKSEANNELKSHICQGAKVWSDLPCSESCHDFCSSRSMRCADAWWSAGEDICMLSLPAKCGDLAGAPWHEGDNLACQCDGSSMEEERQAPKVPELEAEEARQVVKSQICQGDVKVVTDLHCSESCHSYCSGYGMKCVEVWWSSGEDLCTAALPAKCGDMAGAPVNDGDRLVCQCGFAAA